MYIYDVRLAFLHMHLGTNAYNRVPVAGSLMKCQNISTVHFP